MSYPTRRLTEVVAGVGMMAVLVSVALPMVAADRDRSRRGKDAAQLREIHVGLTTWGGSHAGAFPLPSAIDTANATVGGGPGLQRIKDNTGNIFSIMIFNGLLKPEVMVSPVESNGQFAVDSGYEYAAPSRAVDPPHALWDPGYAGTPSDFTGARRQAGVGNCSYAHLLPFFQRQVQWSTAAGPGVVLLSNRGPQFDGTNSLEEGPYPGVSIGWRLAATATGVASNTLLFYPPRNAWTGHSLQADGRVTLTSRPDPWSVQYRRLGTAQPLTVPDNLFVNESDDSTRPGAGGLGVLGTNAYLRQISNASGVDTSTTLTIYRD